MWRRSGRRYGRCRRARTGSGPGGRRVERGDVLADPALVLLGLPVDSKGPTVRNSVKRDQMILRLMIVAEVDPDGHEEDEVRAARGVVEVVERL